ncbi:hypothetical protein [Acidiphilium acidophilum]|uniref:Uncharacterized protein n=1 Tax=Acidiphilium acidophilum TaxID=76588 RepID=A0AAW9DLX9_ACIAO|nr:hypothetical protein [Acidiphilium acidophilum]MDX5929478.1 hypothetical protein [Acidiphilium acidophilum]GBR74271.1 hypothetical protein AA700_0247 [Acidiphilium acidophilum DSM 700]
MNQRHLLFIGVFFVAVWILSLPGAAHAATPPAGSYAAGLAPADVMNQIINVYKQAAAPMAQRLEQLAEDLFFVLAAIEVAWSASRLVLGPTGFTDLIELR